MRERKSLRMVGGWVLISLICYFTLSICNLQTLIYRRIISFFNDRILVFRQRGSTFLFDLFSLLGLNIILVFNFWSFCQISL